MGSGSHDCHHLLIHNTDVSIVVVGYETYKEKYWQNGSFSYSIVSLLQKLSFLRHHSVPTNTHS